MLKLASRFLRLRFIHGFLPLLHAVSACGSAWSLDDHSRHHIFNNIIGIKNIVTKSMTNPPARIIGAIILCVIGVLGSLQLKRSGDISELSFIGLVSLSIFVGFLVFVSDRLTHVSLSKLEMTLQEMRQTEASVKELGRAILAVVEASSHSLMLETFDEKAYNESVERLRKLVV